MKNNDIKPAHLSGKTSEARDRERKDKNNLCKISITVRKQTAFHLEQMSSACGGKKDLGRVVDKLVRQHQLSLKSCEVTEYGESGY